MKITMTYVCPDGDTVSECEVDSADFSVENEIQWPNGEAWADLFVETDICSVCGDIHNLKIGTIKVFL